MGKVDAEGNVLGFPRWRVVRSRRNRWKWRR